MKWFTILCACLLFPSMALASSFRAVYDSGGSAKAKPGQQIRLYINSSQIRIVDERASYANTKAAEPIRSSTVVGIGAFGIGICSRTTISRSSANKRSVLFGVSVVKPQTHGMNFEIFWRHLPETVPGHTNIPVIEKSPDKKPGVGKQADLEPVLCPSPA